jgi:DNA-binding CsgD family transcriptional regulator
MNEAAERRKAKEDRDKRVRAMRAEGASYQQIGDALRLSSSTVYYILTRDPTPNPYSLEVIESKCEKQGSCWLWTKSIRNGVPRTWIDGVQYRVRQLVHAASGEHAPNEKSYDTSCGNGACVAPDHIVINNRGVLSEEQVREIVRLRNVKGLTMDAIANQLDVSAMTVNSIMAGETWGHITGIGK